MAQLADIYLPSLDNAGHTWRIGYYKPQGRPGMVSAVEGESETHENGVRIFRTILFQSRRYRRDLPGRATKRAIALSLAHLLTEMRDAGVIPADRADNYIRQAEAV
jgi:hypothetical protein